ncbi:MAG: CHAP domain-containing protein [Ktedonobacteraceae bacterium]
MSSAENRPNSITTGPLELPGLVNQLSPVDQLSFPDSTTQPCGTPHPSNNLSSPGVTRPLSDPGIMPVVTRNLPEVQTGALFPVKSTTTALRQPVVIRSTGKKSTGTIRAPQGRRWVVHVAATSLLVLIAIGTLMTVLPAGSNGEARFDPFQPILNLAQGDNSNPNLLLAQQAATVTAVTQDGFESGNNHPTYKGLPTAPPSITGGGITGSSGYDGFTYGQCTYWADLRYHQLTGYWVPWGGDAYAWAYGARASGWIVSGTPHVPSIIVLAPGVQGAGGFGHVAVVERINSDGSVYTSNWNWYAGGGGWARLSYWTFSPGPGVTFVWHP